MHPNSTATSRNVGDKIRMMWGLVQECLGREAKDIKIQMRASLWGWDQLQASCSSAIAQTTSLPIPDDVMMTAIGFMEK